MSISVAIDGPSGAGKSTLAKRLAGELGYVYVDTGAMYRAIGLYTLRQGKDPKDAAAVEALLPQINMEAKPAPGGQQMLLNGEDVTAEVRREEVGMAASAVSAHPAVRAFLLEKQREMARSQNVLMDGRDIGTVVLPDATVKIFLTAAAEARAQRRMKELVEKGQPKSFEAVLADVLQRDLQDSTRAAAPLKQAEDAIRLDTTYLDFDESFERMKEIILRRAGLL
ncbi:MAG: (d)CMP kinase [Oscillospiraceae bacterium]|nr:(d)CMP kinase [Oscillospiraceae bacterium]